MTQDKALSWAYAEDYAAEPEGMMLARQQAAELGMECLSPAAGRFLQALAALKSVRNIAEIGTGTGVSGLYLLSAREDSVLTTIDIDSVGQNHARENFTAVDVRPSRYRVINGRSADLLPRLADGSYDMVLVDGDPMEARGDVVEAARMLRSGGVMVIAHALNDDRVADPARRDEVTVEMRDLGREMNEAEDFVSSLIPLGDGLLVCVKH